MYCVLARNQWLHSRRFANWLTSTWSNGCSILVLWWQIWSCILSTPVIFSVFLSESSLHHFVVEALMQSKALTCKSIVGALKGGETRRIPCQSGTFGSVVRIRHVYKDSLSLALCEVQVYGTHGTYMETGLCAWVRACVHVCVNFQSRN